MTAQNTTSAAELRLALRARTANRRVARFVDGGWWPHTRDLGAELAALLPAVEAAGYDDIHRVTYNPDAWDPTPRKILVGSRRVSLGAMHAQPSALITLVGGSGRNIDIVVIPPDAEPDVARAAMQFAAEEHDQHRAPEILEKARRQSQSLRLNNR